MKIGGQTLLRGAGWPKTVCVVQELEGARKPACGGQMRQYCWTLPTPGVCWPNHYISPSLKKLASGKCCCCPCVKFTDCIFPLYFHVFLSTRLFPWSFVGALSPVNPTGLYQGLKQTTITYHSYSFHESWNISHKILNSLSKHFTQTLFNHTSYFIEHTNLSQEVKNCFRNNVPKKRIQRSLLKILYLHYISTFYEDMFNCGYSIHGSK